MFEEDVIRHTQEFLARRRAMRPQEEYRPATEQEWFEFEEHFDKRKVELGSCGRPYGTDCPHEHAPLTELTAEFGQVLTLRSEGADSLPA